MNSARTLLYCTAASRRNDAELTRVQQKGWGVPIPHYNVLGPVLAMETMDRPRVLDASGTTTAGQVHRAVAAAAAAAATAAAFKVPWWMQDKPGQSLETGETTGCSGY
jgi:hypothetical protein